MVPAEHKGLPPGAFLLEPLWQRFSDTTVVSIWGRLDLPRVAQVEIYPIARGRSDMAVRAGHLSQPDTAALLRWIVDALPSSQATHAT
jgi:hypothetical protein